MLDFIYAAARNKNKTLEQLPLNTTYSLSKTLIIPLSNHSIIIS